MSHPLWTLYNSETEQTIENLDIPASLAALSPYSTEQLNVWFAWHEGLTDWKPILELPEFQSLKAPPKPSLSLVSAPEPVAEPVPAPAMIPAAPQPVFEEAIREETVTSFISDVTEVTIAVEATPVEPVPFEPEVFEDVSEKTAFGYNPQDEITKSVDVSEVTEVTQMPVMRQSQIIAEKQFQPEPVQQQPQPAPVAPVEAPVAEDDGHIFWMAEGGDATPVPTSIDEMTTTREYPIPQQQPLPAESEFLAAQAESMPEHGNDAVIGKIETPQRQASFPLASHSAPGDSASNKEPSGKERRKYPRFDIRYRVIVRNDNLTFRTFSRNVSLGGVALEMPVPEALLGSECQIYVGNPKTGENIRFSGKLVANRSDSQYFVFLKSSPDSLSKLQKWVESHQTAAKRVG